jgi:glycosyltransferase involved in cell wall biosynthesis
MRLKSKQQVEMSNKDATQQKVIILVAENVSYDKRVLKSLAFYKDFQVIDCLQSKKKFRKVPLTVYVEAIWVLFYAVISASKLWKPLRQFYDFSFNSFQKNFRSSWNGFLYAHLVAQELHLQTKSVGLIHAHDLFCGLIGAELARQNDIRLIYDAHEVEFHRNRKNSWLRSAFDWSVEKHVIQAADEIRVVNTKIAELYCLVYPGIDSRLKVVPNDHFLLHSVDIETISDSEHAAIVYVGQGVKGRQLEQLALIAKDSELTVHTYFIGEVPAFAINAQWIIGPRDYEDDLVALSQSQRCMMWCCVDITCLSYRLALPNKFFQALAVGMPVIVSKDTYLSEIVHKYKIGIVLDGHDSDWILEQIKSEQFIEWVENIILLRDCLSNKLIAL